MTFTAFISTLCFVLGGVFVLIGALGNLRLPDFFTRLHPAGVHDSLGIGLIILGAIFVFNKPIITFKLILLIVFMLFTGAVATHALAKAAYDSGSVPLGDKLGLTKKKTKILEKKVRKKNV
jgi:multicomponent Na+:H+ antiporter subunit G